IDQRLVGLGSRELEGVRTEGGDPFVCGRGGEEALALAEAGVPFEVVPGVSALSAVPASASIPVTHRGVSAQVTLVSGHSASGEELDYEHLAKTPGTLVVFMGLTHLPEIVAGLLAAGKDRHTPAAVVSNGTRPDGQSVTSTLAEIASLVDGLGSPALLVVGDVGAAADGYIFIAPKRDAPQRGPEIVDGNGQPVWFDPVAAPDQAADFRTQTYQGKPVLTWWEGPVASPILGTGFGHYVIADTSYKEIARVEAGFGRDSGDLHEFELTPQGTALITVYKIVRGSLASIGGPKTARI